MKKFLLQNCIVVPIRVVFCIAMIALTTDVWGLSTWTGNTDANWNNGANWDTNTVPDANTDVQQTVNVATSTLRQVRAWASNICSLMRKPLWM